ncbi:hypothetical protein M0804_013598 [Polistes exclamans]|nr:hypothetical protein M0804_013598 [Polistes exclamans]
MIDTGAEVSFLKMNCILPSTKIEKTDLLQLTGITLEKQNTLEGYMPLLQHPACINAGEALIKNNNVKGFFKISNTTSKQYIFEIPRLEHSDFREDTLLNSGPNTKNQTDEEDSNIDIGIDDTDVLDVTPGEVNDLTGSPCALTNTVETDDIGSYTGNSVLRDYALHTVYRWSVHFIDAIWGSLKNLLLHLKNAGNSKSTRQQEEAAELKEVTMGQPGDKGDTGKAQALKAASASQTGPPS